MTSMSRLGLGTAAFGSHYGLSNRVGRPAESEVAAILERASASGIGYLDTAPAYGDAEALVGRHLPRGYRLRIVTKTPVMKATTIEAHHKQEVLDTLAVSLDRLKVETLHGLLVHQCADLAKPGWQHLVEALAEARARGWTVHVGASVYDSEQLALVESRFQPEIIQLPVNALDRRPIASRMLSRLQAAGMEIHARSVFLQGLLLLRPDDLPDFFRPLREKIAALRRRWAENELSPLAGSLGFVMQQQDIDAIIVGVNRAAELDEIIDAANRVVALDLEPAPAVDTLYLDPSRWPTFVH